MWSITISFVSGLCLSPSTSTGTTSSPAPGTSSRLGQRRESKYSCSSPKGWNCKGRKHHRYYSRSLCTVPVFWLCRFQTQVRVHRYLLNWLKYYCTLEQNFVFLWFHCLWNPPFLHNFCAVSWIWIRMMMMRIRIYKKFCFACVTDQKRFYWKPNRPSFSL